MKEELRAADAAMFDVRCLMFDVNFGSRNQAATDAKQRPAFQARNRDQGTAGGGHLSAANSSSNPRRIFATVQNRADTYHVSLYTVINRKGKAFTQAAMISKNFGMNAAVDSQGVNVSQDGFSKIAS